MNFKSWINYRDGRSKITRFSWCVLTLWVRNPPKYPGSTTNRVLLGNRDTPCIRRPTQILLRKIGTYLKCFLFISPHIKDKSRQLHDRIQKNWINIIKKTFPGWFSRRILLWSNTTLMCPSCTAVTVEVLWSRLATGTSGFSFGPTTLFSRCSSYWSQGIESSGEREKNKTVVGWLIRYFV